MNNILNKIKNYDGKSIYLNCLFIAISAYICSFWVSTLNEPVLVSILGVFLNSYFLWKQKSLIDKLISSVVFNLVFGFFTDYTLFETTQSFLGIKETWRLSLIVLMAGFVRVPSHYFCSLLIHWLQKNKLKVMAKPYFYIGIFSIILSLIERYLYLIVPTEVGFAFLSHIEYLGLLPLFSLLIYSFIIYFGSLVFTFYLNDNDFDLKPFIAVFSVIVISSFGFSFFKPWTQNYNSSDKLKIKVVQYPFHELKNNKEDIDPETLMEQTLFPILENNKADLTIFSESSLPYIYENFHQLRQDSNLNKLLQSNSDLLLSAIRSENKKLYNTSMMFGKGQLPQVYYKKYLFPVGERELVPVTVLNYGEKGIGSSLSQKDHPILIKTKKDFYFSPLLCFENYYPYYLRQFPSNKISSFFTLQSNESWIGDLGLRGLSKIFVQVRSAENATFGIKVDTMGPSFVTNPSGHIDYITYYPKISFDYEVPRKVNLKWNWFFNFGILPFILFNFIYFILLFIYYKRR